MLFLQQYLGNYGMQNLQNYLREKFASSTQRNYCELRGSAEYTTVMQLLDEHRSQGLAHPKLIKLQEVVVNHFRSIVLPPPTSQGTPMSQSRASRVIIFCENRSGVDEIVAALKPHAPLVKAMPFVGQVCRRFIHFLAHVEINLTRFLN
jgi:ERCC4-related helicase